MARDRELTSAFKKSGADRFSPPVRWKRHPLEPVLVSGLLAMSLHAALLTVPIRNEATPVFSGEAGVVRSMSVRILSRLADTGSSASGERIVAVHPMLAKTAHATAAPRVDEPSVRPAPPDRLAPRTTSPASGGVALRLPGVLGDDDFFSRQALDVAPHPTVPVLIEYPTTEEGLGSHSSELTLFIDENGNVVRIRVDGPNLPPAMEAAARAAFMGAMFAPGQVEGLAVRSKIRVEVLFEETPSRR